MRSSEFSSAPYEHRRGAAPLSNSRFVPEGFPGGGGTTAKYSDSKAKYEWEWSWYCCVCHRLLPRGSPLERRIFTDHGKSLYIWPHCDGCIRGEAGMCQMWSPGPATEVMKKGEMGACNFAIGALGWLRVCRQAYIEGSEVLYATNTFVVESRDLLDALCGTPSCDSLISSADQQLLLTQHLAMIKSLELRCEIALFGDLTRSQSPLIHGGNKDRMRRLPNLAGLTASFPNLRSLVISFSEHLYSDSHVRPAFVLRQIVKALLQPLAFAFADLASKQERLVVVELPSNVFRDLKGLELEEEQRGDEWSDGKGCWLRYPIDGSFFYYIKQGEESDLYWDHDGNSRRASDAHSDLR